MAGTIVADDIQHSTAGSVGTEYVVDGSSKMWHLIEGYSGFSTYNSLNVSSITDNGTGLYTRNLTNNFANANYASAVDGGWNRASGVTTRATSSTQTKHATFSLGAADVSYASVTTMGDLA